MLRESWVERPNVGKPYNYECPHLTEMWTMSSDGEWWNWRFRQNSYKASCDIWTLLARVSKTLQCFTQSSHAQIYADQTEGFSKTGAFGAIPEKLSPDLLFLKHKTKTLRSCSGQWTGGGGTKGKVFTGNNRKWKQVGGKIVPAMKQRCCHSKRN